MPGHRPPPAAAACDRARSSASTNFGRWRVLPTPESFYSCLLETLSLCTDRSGKNVRLDRATITTNSQIASSAAGEHHLLRRLRLRDLVLAQILCVVGSSWVGVAAGLGRAQALTWIAAMVVFYFPMAASVICLNRVWPLEGGLYVWAHRAYGDLGGFLIAWNLWVYAISITATILYAIPTELAYLIGPSAAGLPENHLASLTILFAGGCGIAITALRGLEVGKWIHNAGASRSCSSIPDSFCCRFGRCGGMCPSTGFRFLSTFHLRHYARWRSLVR